MPKQRSRRGRRNGMGSSSRPMTVQLSSNDRSSFLESSRLAERSAEPTTRDAVLTRPRQNKPFSIIQSTSSTISSSTSVDVGGSIVLALTSSPDASSWSTVVDSYRIMGCFVKWVPLSSSQTGIVHTAIDYDDGGVPSSEVYMLQYSTNKIAPANVFFEREFVPHVALAAYSGSFTSYAQARVGQWIDVASPNVQHYGLKYYIPSTPSVASTWKVVIDVHFQFKNAR